MKNSFLLPFLSLFITFILNASDEDFATSVLECRDSYGELQLTQETNQGFNGIKVILSPRANEAFAVVHGATSIEPELYQLTVKLGLSGVVPKSMRIDTEVFQQFVLAISSTIDPNSVPDDYKRLVGASKNPLTGGMALGSIGITRQSFDPLVPLIDRLSVQKNFLLWVLTFSSDMTSRNCMLSMSESGKVVIKSIDNDGFNSSAGSKHTYALGLPGCQDPIAPELRELVKHWDMGLIQESRGLIEPIIRGRGYNDQQIPQIFSDVISRVRSLNAFWSTYPNASIRSAFLFAFWGTSVANIKFGRSNPQLLGFDILGALKYGGFAYYGIKIKSEWSWELIRRLSDFMKGVLFEDYEEREGLVGVPLTEWPREKYEIYSNPDSFFRIAKKDGPLPYIARFISWLQNHTPCKRFDQTMQQYYPSDTDSLRGEAQKIIRLIGAEPAKDY